MKKLLTLLLAAGMMFSAANGASAVDIKVSGVWMTTFSFTDNQYGTNALLDDKDRTAEDGPKGTFDAAQRVRINFDLVAGEFLSGRVLLQAAQGTKLPMKYSWGTSGVGGAGKEVTAYLAYLDWMIPTTDVLVRMGRQEVTLPGYVVLSPVLSFIFPVDGVMVSAPVTDMVSVNLGWLRADAEQNKWGGAHTAHSSADFAYLGVNVAADGFKVTPWGMVGFVGEKGNHIDRSDMFGYGAPDESTTAYWVGLGGELSLFDPFKFTADFMYSGNDADDYAEREGWYAALGAEMKTGFAPPFLRGWYASGDDADSRKSGLALSMYRGGGFDASAIYFGADGWFSNPIDRPNPWGTWGVQLGVKNVSFIEDLTHKLAVTYIQGTNNTNRLTSGAWKPAGAAADFGPKATDATYMTTADSAWDIEFLSSYKLYKNLTANILLAYMITDFDKDIRNGVEFENAFRGTLNFAYRF